MPSIDDLPEHLKSRRTAEAIMAPSSILGGGVGAAVAVLVGAPLAVAAGLGVVLYGAGVALRLPRRAKGPAPVDAKTLPEPWRALVRDAGEAQVRFRQVVADADSGPIRERLGAIAAKVDAAVAEAGRIARRGAALDDGLARLDLDRVRRELAQERGYEPPLESEAHQSWRSTVNALQAQVDSGERIARVSAQARDQLRVLDARLDEMVARAVELSLQTDAGGGLEQLGDDVTGLVDEMEALRLGLEEANRATGPGAGGAGGARDAGDVNDAGRPGEVRRTGNGSDR